MKEYYLHDNIPEFQDQDNKLQSLEPFLISVAYLLSMGCLKREHCQTEKDMLSNSYSRIELFDNRNKIIYITNIFLMGLFMDISKSIIL